MQRYEFQLRLDAEKFLAYYRDPSKQVFVRCRNGQNIQFPASLLRKFVTPEGIHGSFVLTCDDNHKGAVLQRLK